ncbi:MAG: methyl-accepting chemotaxis protein [Pirellulales bacterium]
MTIGAKLGAGFGTVIALLAISAGTAYYNISIMRTSLGQVLDEAVPTVRSCDRLLGGLSDASAGLRGYVAVESGAAQANTFRADNAAAWQSIWEQLDLLAKYASLDDGIVERRQLDLITQMARDLHDYHQQVFALADTKQNSANKGSDKVAVEEIWLNKVLPNARKITTAAEQITAAAQAKQELDRDQLDTASQTTVVALGTATLISIFIGCGVAIVLSRKMATTVRSLADRAKQISEGDLRGEAIVKRGADELGQLADGFNVMLANLRDLTGQILSVTENVNSAASQISSSAKQQATSTKEQAATVQEITSTMQEISQSGGQIVAKAKEVAAVAEQASSASKSGMDAVQNTNRTMEAIREQVEEVAENIVALSEKTQAVGEIISTVNEIAEQSNLLALNATIEAAEAGTEGSRFSVVAGEMKNLADQAKECTVHVRKILGEIQKAINTSVMLTEEAVKRVESGKQQADVSENVIRQISSTTDESIQAFQQIIAATNQQQVGLEQVARGMQDIDQAAQQTATGTGQLEQAVVNLSAMSKQLRTAVASYKV